MAELTKEWLLTTIAELEEERDATPGAVNEDAAMALAAMKIALASLEAEAVAWLLSGGGAKNNVSFDSGNAYADPLREVTPLYTAPPAPVSVPAAMEMDDDFDSAFEHGKAVGWNAYRAAMLQGADRPQNEPQNIPENIPATQFKPVADLYGLTSPTGGETSFTFDAVEARDFIDGGWLCQEYVTLERYQETLFQGAEPVSLRDGIAAIRNLGPIDAEKIQAERDALNSPVITDDVRRMDWLVSKTVDVREPMVYGSHSLFWSQAITDEEDDYHATKLREQIDAAMAAEQAAAPQQEVES